MASPHQLPRLHIPQHGAPPPPKALFTPGLPSALQGNFPLPTPLNNNFGAQIPPRHAMHRTHPSLVFSNPFATAMPPHPNIVMTPGGMAATPMFGGPGFPRNRRTPSVSLGGPPKAVLGGPSRKVTPMTASASTVAAASVAGTIVEKLKAKKAVVKLPIESTPRDSTKPDKEIKYSLWSRVPLKFSTESQMKAIKPPEITTCEPHPIEIRGSFPATIDVYLPGKSAWDEYYQKLVEEKLERLGVENGGNSLPSTQSHLHGRAMSISSPADPGLLMFKLNKLQQSQNTSLAPSPQPTTSVASVSPNPHLPPRFQQAMGPGHAHSFSLANYNSVQPALAPSGALNYSLSPGGYIGEQGIIPPSTDYFNQTAPGPLHAPQGVAPVAFNIHSELTSASSGPSRVTSTIPDFNRGFGIDIPEEDEEEVQASSQPDDVQIDDNGASDADADDDATTAGVHTRHASKASIATSVRNMDVQDTIEENMPPELDRPVEWNIPSGSYSSPPREKNEIVQDFVGEWTGTESLGEFSNPSDEERARQERDARRMSIINEQTSTDLETPRRIPEFPKPPSGTHLETYTNDEIVSNPSDEEPMARGSSWLHPAPQQTQQDYAHYQPIVDGQPRSPRPLPPLPHSRTASGQYSHPPTTQHSRQPSRLHEPELPSIARRDSLNPFAKPFVFGSGSITLEIPKLSTFDAPDGHNRQQSLGRPLNAAAAEFKPGFTFVPPPGVPKVAFPTAEPTSRPLPHPPIGISPARVQGREKRQRKDSQGSAYSEEDQEGLSVMSTFKFPSPSKPIPIRPDITNIISAERLEDRPISPLPQRKLGLNAAAAPFTFNPTSSSLVMPEPTLTQQPEFDNAEPHTPEPNDLVAFPEPMTHHPATETVVSEPSPSTVRKRPPVLDFKHPTSTHTVPAALFRKALFGTDLEGSTRATVRSRLSSREIFEHMNSPSLDDTNVPAISRRSQLAARSNLHTQSDSTQEKADSVPQTGGTSPPISESKLSLYTRRQEQADYLEQRLEDMLDDRMELVKQDLVNAHHRATDSMIAQIISAVKAHVSEIASGLEEDAADARGEIDFELIRNTLEQGVMDIRTGLRRDLEEVLRSVEAAHHGNAISSLPGDFQRAMEEFGNRSMGVMSNAVVQIVSRVEQIEEVLKDRADEERVGMVNEMFGMISDAIRQPSVDFDAITARLAEAVKPHISQLIDLTSDKRETAGLIVQHLMPTLDALAQNPVQMDTDAIVSHLRVELARMVPGSDPHALKEAVADLVVERLDSRLAVRDKINSSERLYSFISERIDDLHAPVSDVRKAVENLHTGQASILEQSETLNKLHQDMAAQLLGLPAAVKTTINEIQATAQRLLELKETSTTGATTGVSEFMTELETVSSTVRKLATNHEYLASQSANFVSLLESLQNSVTSLPQSLIDAVNSLKEGQEELLAKVRNPDTSQATEVRNLRASNAELQVQIAKARGAHGQIRVEKDLMFDRVTAAETERDTLRAQLDELRIKSAAKETEVAAAGLRITELEDRLSHARARLEASEVTYTVKDDRIVALERQNHEYSLEQYQLKSKIQRLELQEGWFTRDKASLEERLSHLQKDKDDLLTQQSRWEELRRTNEQVEHLTKLISAADSAQLAELEAASKRANVLEVDHAALQKKYKEQEAKIANLERSSLTTRQNFAQAQQRISEWEKRANELESELEATRARLEETDEARLQLDSDLSLVRMHLEEKEAAARASKELETKLRGDVSSLETSVSKLKSELEELRQARAPAPVNTTMSATQYWAQNGYANGQIARPSSRASTINIAKSPVTPTGPTSTKKSQYSHTPSEAPSSPGGVSTSMYASQSRGRRYQYPSRSLMPSPTPSTVTQGDDGWWTTN